MTSYTSSGDLNGSIACNIASSPNVAPRRLATDNLNNIYVVGNYTLYNPNGFGGFVWKVNSSLSSVFVNLLGQNTEALFADSVYGVVTDSQNNYIITGGMPNPVGEPAGTEAFISKYDSTGNQIWISTLGNKSEVFGLDVVITPSNELYVLGNVSGGLDGNAGIGAYDLFLAKFNSSGKKE